MPSERNALSSGDAAVLYSDDDESNVHGAQKAVRTPPLGALRSAMLRRRVRARFVQYCHEQVQAIISDAKMHTACIAQLAHQARYADTKPAPVTASHFIDRASEVVGLHLMS
jgi:hypothetical protein